MPYTEMLDRMNTDISSLKDDVGGIKTDIVDLKNSMQFNGLMLDRFDTALEKMTEVSKDISQTLAVQEQRLTTAENNIVEGRTDRVEFNEKLDKRVGLLERWKYLVIGGAFVVGWIINRMTESIPI